MSVEKGANKGNANEDADDIQVYDHQHHHDVHVFLCYKFCFHLLIQIPNSYLCFEVQYVTNSA